MTEGARAGKGLRELASLLQEVAASMEREVQDVAAYLSTVLEGGGKLMFCGNGGSAADAQHLAAEFVVRFSRERRPLPALALTTDTSVLTAAANDFGFDRVFSRQVEALGVPGDCLILHSTSGESENLLRAAEAARAKGIGTVGFLAKGGGRLASAVDRAVVIPTSSTARAQEVHLALGHIICEIVEETVARGAS